MKFSVSSHTPTIQFKDLPLGEVFTRPDKINMPAIKTGDTTAIFYPGSRWFPTSITPELIVISYPEAELILHEPCYTHGL